VSGAGRLPPVRPDRLHAAIDVVDRALDPLELAHGERATLGALELAYHAREEGRTLEGAIAILSAMWNAAGPPRRRGG